MEGEHNSEYGVRCNACGGVFAGVGPSDKWGHNAWTCASQTLPALRERIEALELALSQIADFNSPEPGATAAEERDTLIAIARNAMA